jgi:hypothetical protein
LEFNFVKNFSSFVGCGPDMNPTQAFCGQIGAIYTFAQTLSPQQVKT